MKRYGLLAVLSCAVLAVFAVWMGALNQDEGWYLYAAQLVAEGKRPYADFFYTQAPLMPYVYSLLVPLWKAWGLLGARVATLVLGLGGIGFAVLLARRFAPPERRMAAGVIVALLLGCNLYHLYYLAIPKTYALASLLATAGCYLLSFSLVSHNDEERPAAPALFGGIFIALAAATRISMGLMLATIGFALLFSYRRYRLTFLWFGLGGVLGLAAAFGPFLSDASARAGLVAAQAYHAARGGFDPVMALGSVSRLVRWYLSLWVLGGWALLRGGGAAIGRERTGGLWIIALAALSVMALQLASPCPYDDYQVPVMGLLAVVAAVLSCREEGTANVLLALGLAWAASFGSPLLEQWKTDGQDRFWTLRKSTSELGRLRETARRIEMLDPGGTMLLTQDLYLAIETRRKVPEGLEMGPFSYWPNRSDLKTKAFAGAKVLDDAAMEALVASAPCAVAALSGYTFAIAAPVCDETPIDRQIALWSAVKRNYALKFKEERFGQNATTLLVLKRKTDR